MNKKLHKILSLALAFILSFALCMPSYSYIFPGYPNIYEVMDEYQQALENTCCPLQAMFPNSGHHTKDCPGEGLGGGGTSFGEEAIKQAEQEYTASIKTGIGSTIVTSNGGIVIATPIIDVVFGSTGIPSGLQLPIRANVYPNKWYDGVLVYSENTYVIEAIKGEESPSPSIYVDYVGKTPEAGTYSLYNSVDVFASASYPSKNATFTLGGSGSSEIIWDGWIPPSNRYLAKDTNLVLSLSLSFAKLDGKSPTHYRVRFPEFVYYVYIPLSAIAQQNINNIKNDSSTRIGSVALNYAYTDNSSGDIITTDNTRIVNEDNRTFYNPVTGDTYNYTDWSYDYSNRSYNLTLDNSKKMTVTYADESLTIYEGDSITENTIVYNINYVLASSGGSTTDPTPSPSPGGNGNNNNGDDDDDDGGWLDGIWDAIIGGIANIVDKIITGIFTVLTNLINAVVKFIVDVIDGVIQGLTAIVDLILKSFLEIPQLFSGFLDFLAAVFPFMPPEFVTVIMFGILALIVAAILKRFLG